MEDIHSWRTKGDKLFLVNIRLYMQRVFDFSIWFCLAFALELKDYLVTSIFKFEDL